MGGTKALSKAVTKTVGRKIKPMKKSNKPPSPSSARGSKTGTPPSTSQSPAADAVARPGKKPHHPPATPMQRLMARIRERVKNEPKNSTVKKLVNLLPTVGRRLALNILSRREAQEIFTPEELKLTVYELGANPDTVLNRSRVLEALLYTPPELIRVGPPPEDTKEELDPLVIRISWNTQLEVMNIRAKNDVRMDVWCVVQCLMNKADERAREKQRKILMTKGRTKMTKNNYNLSSPLATLPTVQAMFAGLKALIEDKRVAGSGDDTIQTAKEYGKDTLDRFPHCCIVGSYKNHHFSLHVGTVPHGSNTVPKGSKEDDCPEEVGQSAQVFLIKWSGPLTDPENPPEKVCCAFYLHT